MSDLGRDAGGTARVNGTREIQRFAEAPKGEMEPREACDSPRLNLAVGKRIGRTLASSTLATSTTQARDMLCLCCGRRHSEGRFLFLRKSPSGDHQAMGLCSPECEREHEKGKVSA